MGLFSLWLAASDLAETTVSTEVAVCSPGITADGENEQLSETGNPAQVSATSASNEPD